VTQRKPKDETFEDFVERQIREARERGDLDRLAGEGKPLRFLGKPHDPMRWVREKLEREKLSLLPDALELRREAERTLADLPRYRSEEEARDRLEALNQRIRSVNRTSWNGPPTDLAPLDVEEWLGRWRASRRR
jgi:hypothetical protein